MVRKPKPLLLLAMIAGLAACDRPPRNAAAPAPVTAPAAPATVAPSSAATVALSGAISDLPAATTPDAVPSPTGASTIQAGSSVTPMPSPRRTPPPARPSVREPVVTRAPVSSASGETEAMREFREAQEQRDRELLERDLDEVRQGGGTDRGSAATVDEVPPQDYLDDGARIDELEEAPLEGGLDQAPLDDGFEEPPLDDGFDEPPLDDEYPDELPPEDDELQWDPATGTWR